jgi:glutamate synthase domain-containing protein 2/glutamate synthase domain-containing protein 1/glutamate synthase domain-containing protein 3
MIDNGLPPRRGLYDPANEKDSCGVGFVVDIKGNRSHGIVRQGLEVLINLTHRGAVGSEANTGDGAGLTIQIPHAFLSRECAKLGFSLVEEERSGVGMLFLPQDATLRARVESAVNDAIVQQGLKVLGWRTVPTDGSHLGKAAQSSQPYVRQVFIEAPAGREDRTERMALERKLFLVRRIMERAVEDQGIKGFYACSLSSKVIVYKGMLIASQIEQFYPELCDEAVVSAIALVHARYSTNTFPSWPLAQPFRIMAHNGEINTLRGNMNWQHSREKNLTSRLFGKDLPKLFPVIDSRGSDSSIFDNMLEFLVQTGRSLPHAMMMMIPEAWDENPHMDDDRRAFYQYHATLMEPWDGPAAIAYTDGTIVGANLDRNGLRPARIVVTKDGRAIMASEVGVLDIAPENVLRKTRLRPGRIFVVDTEQGRIIEDEELKANAIAMHPFRQWNRDYIIELESLAPPPHVLQPDYATILQRQRVFGYTKEDLKLILPPLAKDGEEAIGSMGTDIPLAVLSDRPVLLFNYFKQNFAQVTNPAIDSTREYSVMSLATFLGKEGNLLDEKPVNAHVLRLPHPILTNYDLERLRHVTVGDFQAKTLPMLFDVHKGTEAMEEALDDLNRKADQAVRQGYSLIILTDRGVDSGHAPIPSLLATSSVHHHLIRNGNRTNVALVVETGEAREVHHFSLLVGYGASAVNPYLAFETLVDQNTLFRHSHDSESPKAVKNYIKGLKKGMLKVFAKMGISTLQSYHGAQMFEALGLNRDLVERCFTGTASRIGGIGLAELAQEALRRHELAYPAGDHSVAFLDVGGMYQWRRDGEHHLLNPETIWSVQSAVRLNSQSDYDRYAQLINDQSRKLGTLRGLFEFKRNPIPLDQVEPATEIVRRFATGAMSLGSISREAHETLAIAMNRIGGKSNTGEGGEDPARYQKDPNGDSRNSAIKQVASGRFGVNSYYLVNARELQIKIAQGAKPGEGGQLPGHKISEYIGKIRLTMPGVPLISPPPHHDIYSIEDLKQLIFDLKNGNPDGEVSVKLVAESGVGTVAAGVAKAKADMVLISGHDGGTGASPLTSIQYAGVPWEIGLAETQQTLVMNNLRGRIRVQTDGQLKTGRDVVIAALLGAEEFGFSTVPLVALGCIMMRVCHLNTCPVGIATQDERLRKKFEGKPEHVIAFFMFVAEEARRHMAELGFRSIAEMVGRVDRLEIRPAIAHWKAKGLDFSEVLYQPKVGPEVATHHVDNQDHEISGVLDHELIERCRDALEHKKPVRLELPIRNSNRTAATMLGARLSKKHGMAGLPDDTIHIKFNGSAGQSFGAFTPRGITLELEGDANDYTGKGLSGGRMIVYPPKGSTFAPEENLIVGNVVLYGATAGEAFFGGMAGERFAIRNSGVHAVVEGVGDHGCEYMTGGVVVVLGETGPNFAAGMSGGYAYVLNEDGRFAARCNKEMVDLESLDGEDQEQVRALIDKHHRYTGSPKAKRVLEAWDKFAPLFVKVFPRDYRRVLLQRQQTPQRESA